MIGWCVARSRTKQSIPHRGVAQSPRFLCLLPEPAFLPEVFPHFLYNLFLQGALHAHEHSSLHPESQSAGARRRRRCLPGDLKEGSDWRCEPGVVRAAERRKGGHHHRERGQCSDSEVGHRQTQMREVSELSQSSRIPTAPSNCLHLAFSF